MQNFAAIVDSQLAELVRMLGPVPVTVAAGVMADLPDDEVVRVIESTSSAIRELEALRVVATGVAAQRSPRDAGHGGLAQKRGHRSAVALIQDLTGTTRAQAAKAAQAGRAFLDGAPPAPTPVEATERPIPPPRLDADTDTTATTVWHACLGEAFTTGRITLDQHTAIRRGLGEPPADVDADAAVAWATAAEQLVDEASRRTVEDLGAAARAIRDHLDPEGAARRFQERYERRSFRIWTDRDGIRHGSFTFDDHGAAWVTTVIDSALRPRRGGPRFIDPDEKTAADALIADPRTNEQLSYDLILDLLHTGARADTATVFGTRQAGLRVVVTDSPDTAILEDTGTTVPAAFAAQHACDAGSTQIAVDLQGNPLALGRTARLFTAKQRLALAQRDGGCGWTGCDRPAASCEAHHIDKYSEGGRTDVERGILLCRFHHMNLHHHGWTITRQGTGPFLLRSPDPTVEPVTLHARLERRYAFGDLRPALTRFRPAA